MSDYEHIFRSQVQAVADNPVLTRQRCPLIDEIRGHDLLAKIYEKAVVEPTRFQMNYWAADTECGTSYCVAGWAVALNGAEPLFNGGHTAQTARYPDGKIVDIMAEGIRLLGPELIGGLPQGFSTPPDDTRRWMQRELANHVPSGPTALVESKHTEVTE